MTQCHQVATDRSHFPRRLACAAQSKATRVDLWAKLCQGGEVGFLEMLEIVSFYEFLVFGDVLGFELLKMMAFESRHIMR